MQESPTIDLGFVLGAPLVLEDVELSDDGEIVYFIQAKDGGPVKIGVSSSQAGVDGRLSALQTGNPLRLVVRRMCHPRDRGGARFLERQLHDYFSSIRLVGEWFDATPELLDVSGGVEEKEEAFSRGHRRGIFLGIEEGEKLLARRLVFQLVDLAELDLEREFADYSTVAE